MLLVSVLTSSFVGGVVREFVLSVTHCARLQLSGLGRVFDCPR